MTEREGFANLDTILTWLRGYSHYLKAGDIKENTFPDLDVDLFDSMLEQLVDDGYIKMVGEVHVTPIDRLYKPALFRITFKGQIFEGYEKEFIRENSEALSSAKTEKLLTDLQIILAVGAVALFLWQIWEWVWDNFCFC